MDAPWLSVIMPTYNGEEHLRAALESLERECRPDVEVIAVDDGSTDRTPEILEAYRSRLPLRILRRAHRGNWVSNTNVGLEEADGEYACFLHQDDLWVPGRLTKLRAWLKEHGDVDFLIHSTRYIDRGGRTLGYFRPSLPEGRLRVGAATIVERLLVQNFVGCPSTLFRREAALRGGGMDERLWYTADWDLWLSLAARGNTGFLKPALSAYRVHEGSQTSRRCGELGEVRRQQELVLEKHLAKWPGDAAPGRRGGVVAAARFSIELNSALALASSGVRVPVWPLIRRFLNLRPAGWRRYLRDSRIAERVAARLRAKARSIEAS